MGAIKRIARGVTVLAIVGWGVTQLPPVAGAALIYTGSADASGVRVSETLPGGPGSDTLINGGGPVAQAVLTSNGTSTSFASNPYPGDVPVSFPGTMAGLAPQAPRIPDYPLYVRAEYPASPAPTASSFPGTNLVATAQRSEAASSASTGGGDQDNGAGRYQSSARVTSAAGAVRAVANSTGRSISLGPLQIGSFASTATAILQPDGGLTRQSSLDIGGLTVAGQGVIVQNGVLLLAGTKVPLQGSPLAPTLTQSGLEVSYLAAEDTPTGLISEALVVRRAQSTPRGVVTVALTFGQAIASISGSVVPDPLVSVGADDGPTAMADGGAGALLGAVPPVLPASGTGAATTVVAPRSLTAPELTALAPVAFGSVPGGETAPFVPEGRAARTATVALAQPAAAAAPLLDVRGSYGLIAGALILIMLARVIASRVSLPWSS
jgi:hypothetical protein